MLHYSIRQCLHFPNIPKIATLNMLNTDIFIDLRGNCTNNISLYISAFFHLSYEIDWFFNFFLFCVSTQNRTFYVNANFIFLNYRNVLKMNMKNFL